MPEEFVRQHGREIERSWGVSQVSHWTTVHTGSNVTLSTCGATSRSRPGTIGLSMPVGQLADRTNIIVFRSSGGTIFHEVTGNRIEFERAGGVYRLNADESELELKPIASWGYFKMPTLLET